MKIKLQNLISSLGMTDSQVAMEIEKMCGKTFPSQLITNAVDGVPIPALRAELLCQWLSTEFGKAIKPEDISDLHIHAFSALPEKAGTGESVTLRTEKIKGFVEGFNVAYAARFNNQTLSNTQIHQLASEAVSKQPKVFQESVQPAGSHNAFCNAYSFAGNVMEAIYSRPNGAQKFQELKAMDRDQREQYARSMARDCLKYL